MDSNKNISDLINSSRVKVTDELEFPPVILRVENVTIGTLGNFSASTGKAKSRKTFNIGGITAAALINSTVLKYTATLPSKKRKILYIDTEQSLYHCQKSVKRIVELSNLSTDVHPDNLDFLSLRRFSPKLRISIIEQAIKNTNDLGLVIVDGLRDLAYDINSPSEATELITRFMNWTEEFQIHIHTVLHQNKNDENTRGHLGTELNNKAETIIQVAKDSIDRNISTVRPLIVRDKEFDSFAFQINDDELPEILYDFSESAKRSKTFDYFEVSEERHREALTKLFQENKIVSYSVLVDLLQKYYSELGYTFGVNKAKNLKSFLENKRMILKDGKNYIFNEEFYY